MLSKNKVQEKLNHNSRMLRENFGIKKIGLFGSYVHNRQNEDSDIDILVEFSVPVGLFKFVQLQNTLTEVLHNPVDLVTSEALKPLLKQSILNEVEWVEVV